MSEAGDVPDVRVRPELRPGVYADYVEAFGDLAEVTLDFARLDPREPTRGDLVARVALSRWCILKLHRELARRIE